MSLEATERPPDLLGYSAVGRFGRAKPFILTLHSNRTGYAASHMCAWDAVPRGVLLSYRCLRHYRFQGRNSLESSLYGVAIVEPYSPYKRAGRRYIITSASLKCASYVRI